MVWRFVLFLQLIQFLVRYNKLYNMNSTVVVISCSQFSKEISMLMSSDITVEDDIDFSIWRELLKLGSFDLSDCRSCLFVEPVHHKLFSSLSVVFDLLTIAEVNQGWESSDLIRSLDWWVLIGINFGKTNCISHWLPGDPASWSVFAT